MSEAGKVKIAWVPEDANEMDDDHEWTEHDVKRIGGHFEFSGKVYETNDGTALMHKLIEETATVRGTYVLVHVK